MSAATRLLILGIFLTACTATENATRSGPNGTEIQIQDGRNCWKNRCLTFDSRYRSIAVTGKNPTRIPRGVDVSDGYVTEAEFAAMFQAANMAYGTGVGRR